MSENYFAPRRIAPLHSPSAAVHAAENTAQTNDLQPDAGARSGVHEDEPTAIEEYTISVDQVRAHLREKGLSKSKDTVQRWCRTGELDCQKRGVLGRYFATETSLLALQKKLLPDMIAEDAGASLQPQPSAQLHAAADAAAQGSMPGHEGVDAAARTSMQPDEGEDVQVHAAASSSEPAQTPALSADADRARLAAENEGLRSQLENRDKQIDFLQEEIKFARGERGDVVKISNRMLETLETMAIGGRLERPKREGSTPAQSTETVRVEVTEPEGDRVY